MSYDLFFRARDKGQSFTQSDFDAYFRSRKNYTVEKRQAIYQNESTDVYFIFDFGQQEEDALAPFAFNLNYFRPHFFGLEAEPELAAFIKHFNLLVSDPQVSGMGDGEYTAEGFLTGWNNGNEFGCKCILSQNPSQQIWTMTYDKIEAYWKWNHAKDAFQERIGDNVFVPRIMMFENQGQLVSGVAWGDGIPIMLPEVDIVIIPRQELAPRSFFGKTKEDMVVVKWADLLWILSEFQKETTVVPFYKLDYASRPQAVESFVCKQKTMKPKLTMIPMDQVIDQEIVERNRKMGS